MHGLDEWLVVCFIGIVVAVLLGVAVFVAHLRIAHLASKATHDEELRRTLAATVGALQRRLSAMEAAPRGTVPLDSAGAATPPPLPAAMEPSVQRKRVATELVSVAAAVPSPLAPSPQVPVQDGATDAPPARPLSLESFLGGRVLLAVGVVSVLIGAAFFLKLAIDRDWIGPAARIALGVVAGLAAMFGGDLLRRRGFRYYGSSLMGGGIGLLYLCDYFASVRYGMWSRPVAFALAGAITAGGCVLALLRDAPQLAWFGFVGAFLAPAILGSGEDAIGPLTLWLVGTNVGIAVLMVRRGWRGFDTLAIVSHVIYYIGWHLAFFTEARASVAAVCLFTLMALPPAIGIASSAWRRSTVAVSTFVALAIAVIAGVSLGEAEFRHAHRTALGAGVFLAAVLVGGLAAYTRTRRAEEPRAARDVNGLTGVALALSACALLYLLRGTAVAPVFALAGALLVRMAYRRSAVAATAGWAFIGIAAIDVLAAHLPASREEMRFLNADFFVSLAPAIAAFTAAWPRVSESGEDSSRGDRALAASIPFVPPILAIVRGLAIAAASALIVAEAARAVRSDTEAFDNAARVAGRVARSAFAAAACAAIAAVLVHLRRRFASIQLLPFGPLLLATWFGVIAAATDVGRHYQEFPGSLFLACLACVAALALASFLDVVRRITGAAAALLFLIAISCRIHAWGVEGGDWLRGQMWMSGAWALYATALLAAGFAQRAPMARWSGIGLFFATAAKVVLIDLSRLDTPARVGSFLVLGVLLVGVSFLYQRLTRDPAPPA